MAAAITAVIGTEDAASTAAQVSAADFVVAKPEPLTAEADSTEADSEATLGSVGTAASVVVATVVVAVTVGTGKLSWN